MPSAIPGVPAQANKIPPVANFGSGISPDKLLERTATATRPAPPAPYFGAGVPDNSLGTDGSVYFRIDGTVGAFIYQRRAGVWVATAA